MLKEGGRFSVNGFEVSSEHVFWKQLFDEMGLKTAFIDMKLQSEVRQTECFRDLLQNHFAGMESVSLDNSMRYEDSESVIDRLYQRYPENRKYIEDNEKLIRQHIERILDTEGVIVVDNTSTFWQCRK